MAERRASPYPKITAAIKAARRAGETGEVRVEVEGITVVSSAPEPATQPAQGRAEWRKRIEGLR